MHHQKQQREEKVQEEKVQEKPSFFKKTRPKYTLGSVFDNFYEDLKKRNLHRIWKRKSLSWYELWSSLLKFVFFCSKFHNFQVCKKNQLPKVNLRPKFFMLNIDFAALLKVFASLLWRSFARRNHQQRVWLFTGRDTRIINNVANYSFTFTIISVDSKRICE